MTFDQIEANRRQRERAAAMDRSAAAFRPHAEAAIRAVCAEMRFDPMPPAVRRQMIAALPSAMIVLGTNWHISSTDKMRAFGSMVADTVRYAVLGRVPSREKYTANMLEGAEGIAYDVVQTWARVATWEWAQYFDGPVEMLIESIGMGRHHLLPCVQGVEKVFAQHARFSELPPDIAQRTLALVHAALPEGQLVPPECVDHLRDELAYTRRRMERRNERRGA